MTQTEPIGPLPPQKMRTKLDRFGYQLQLEFDSRRPFWGTVLLLFWCVWLFASLIVFYAAYLAPNPVSIAFALFFAWACWRLPLSALKHLFQVEELDLGPAGLRYRRRLLWNVQSRDIPLAEIQGFEGYTKVVHYEGRLQESGIEIRTMNKPLPCFHKLPVAELDWLLFQLNHYLALMKGESATQVAQAWFEQDRKHQEQNRVFPRPLALDGPPAHRPIGSHWKQVEGNQSLEFVKHEQSNGFAIAFTLQAFISTAAVAAYFVWTMFKPGQAPAPLDAGEWWTRAAFFTFVLGGALLMGWEFYRERTKSKHATTWKISMRQIELSKGLPGQEQTTAWPIERLRGIELRKTEHEKMEPPTKWHRPTIWVIERRSFQLAFLNPAGEAVCEIADLAEDEARWIGQTILRERAAWFS